MSDRSYAVALACVLMAGILVAWSPGIWAVSVLESGILLLGLIWFAERLGGHGACRRTWLLLPLALIALWGPLQLAIGSTVYRFPAWNATLFWGTNALFFWIALQSLQASRTRELFLSILLGFGCALAILAVLQHYTAPGKVLWCFQTSAATFGPFVYKNQFAAFIEILLPVALYRLLVERRRTLFYALCVAAMAAAVVASASRTGTLLVFAEIAIILAAGYWRGMLNTRELSVISVTVFASVAVFVAVAGWQSIWIHFHEENPSLMRARLLHSTLNMIRDRPLTGAGLGNWRVVYPAYALFDNSLAVNEAHNDWAQWAAEGGLPFFLLMLAIALGSIPQAWRSLWGLGAVAVLAHALVDYPTREPALSALLFAFLGAIAASRAIRPRSFPPAGA